MKKILTVMVAVGLPFLGACSRAKNEAVRPPATPNQNLQRDAERLQQATANAAREREKAAQAAATPSATP